MSKLPEFSKLKELLPVSVETNQPVVGYYLSANEKKIKKRILNPNTVFNLVLLQDESFKKSSEWLKNKNLIGSNLVANNEIERGKKVDILFFFVYEDLVDKSNASRRGKIAIIKEEKQKSDFIYGIPKKFLFVTGGFLLMVLGYKLYKKKK
jgi:hypothetical protein